MQPRSEEMALVSGGSFNGQTADTKGMLTRIQHMYSTPGRPLRDAVTSRSLSKADSATVGASISQGYSVWVTGRWKGTSLHFNAPYRADLWRG